VQLSAQASNDVYKTPEHESVDGNRIFFPPKIDGTFKATLVVELNNEDGTQVLMISIRGSAPKVIDWITNVNCDPVMDGNSFLVRQVYLLLYTMLILVVQPPLNDVGKGPVAIHNGFLRVATSMASQVEQILQQKATSLDDPSTVDLVFTGHSAGGAVAALLFAHMLTPGMEEICSSKTATTPGEVLTYASTLGFHNVHCITFGAPPIFTPSHLLEQYLPASSLFISVINQGDPIPRTDKLYLHALVDLYAQPVTGSTDQLWSAPPLTIFNAGTLVVLRIEDEEQPELDVHAYCIQAQDVQGLLAVRLAMHKKRHYVEMVDAFVKRL